MALLTIAALLSVASPPPALEDRYYCIATHDLTIGYIWVVQTMSLKGVRDMRQSGWYAGAPDTVSVMAYWDGDYVPETGRLDIQAALYNDVETKHRYRIDIGRDDGRADGFFLTGPLQSPDDRRIKFSTTVGVLRSMARGVPRLTVSILRDDGSVFKRGVYESSLIEQAFAEMPGLQRRMDAMLADPEKTCQHEDPDHPIMVVG